MHDVERAGAGVPRASRAEPPLRRRRRAARGAPGTGRTTYGLFLPLLQTKVCRPRSPNLLKSLSNTGSLGHARKQILTLYSL